jgi:high affinity sulfate transporter 1
MKTNTLSDSRFGLFQGIFPVQRSEIWKDVIAGVTLAALGIPEVMGYTRIAQTPAVTGLYTLVLPVIVFAILGSSRHLVVAADSATAAILAGAVVHYAAPYSREYVALTSFLALLCAGMLAIARVFRLGFLADFLSRSALMGFLTGVGVQVAAGEVGPLLGIPQHGHRTVERLLNTLLDLNRAQRGTALVAVCVLLVIIILGRLAPRFPGALVAVVGAIVVNAALNLQRFGVETIGSIPGGLPHFGLHVRWSAAPSLLAAAASCSIVIIAQSAATSRSYALRFGDAFSENRDMVGLAAANIAASVTGTFVVNGSPTKTEMVDMAGGHSQIVQLTTSAIILLVLLFLTRPLSYMPEAVLSAVVFLIGLRLVDVTGFRDLYRRRRDEFWIATFTALTVAIVGVEQGILLAVAVSLIDHLRVSYRPPTRLLKVSEAGDVTEFPVSSREMALPGLMIFRFEAPLYYANSEFFRTEVLQLVGTGETRVRWLTVRLGTISDVDYTASKMLLDLIRRLQQRGVTLAFTDVDTRMGTLLQHYGIAQVLGSDKLFANVTTALTGYRMSLAGEARQGGQLPYPN